MAKRRRRRGFGSYVSIPSLGNLKEVNPLGKSVNSTDVLVGAAIGLAGGAFVKMGISKLDVATGGKVPAFVKSYVGPISTFLAGVASYYVAKKMMKKPGRGTGYLVGATSAAVAPLVWEGLKAAAPNTFNDYVAVSPLGLLTQDAGMSGFGVLSRDVSGYGEEESVFEAP